jgi:hypothetical protein
MKLASDGYKFMSYIARRCVLKHICFVFAASRELLTAELKLVTNKENIFAVSRLDMLQTNL